MGSLDALRRSSAAVLLAWLALGPAGCGPPRPAQPHVLLIVVDAASAAYFGFLGGEGEPSPNVDGLAAESVVFETAYAQAPTTVVSTASLMTGVRGTTHLMTPRSRLPGHLPTLAEILGGAGYRTYGIIGNPFAGAPALGLDRGYDECVQVYAEPSLAGARPREKSNHFIVTLPEDINRHAFTLLPHFAQGPSFAYVHYLQPHKPYDPPAEHLAPFLAREGVDAATDWDVVHEAFELANETGETSVETIATLEARYRANIRHVDAGIGALLDRLRDLGLYDETLILLTSDHGDAFFKHRRFGHNRTLYDDMTRVPFLIKFPARDGVAPRRIDDLVETIDVLPTLLDRLGIDAPPGIEGDSLLPLVRGERAGWAGNEVVLATATRRLQAIRVGRHKYIHHVAKESGELYDLVRDPDEQHDLADAEPELARRLRERLDAIVNLGARPGLTEDNRLRQDPEMDRLLDTLGYTGDEDED